MKRKLTAFHLLVIDDGERVHDENYPSQHERTVALHDLVFNNHDEIELCPDRITDDAEIAQWYQEEGADAGLDVYLDEIEVDAVAPQNLFHVVTEYDNGQDIAIASYSSEEARRLGLLDRVRSGVFADVDEEADVETLIEAIKAALPAKITLMDAVGDDEDLEWYA